MHRLHFKGPKTNIADFIWYSTVLLKSWIILCTLSVYMVALLYFYFERVHHVELAIRQLHFEVTKISFFVILQMRTTIHYKNSISRSIINSHDKATSCQTRTKVGWGCTGKERDPNKLGTRNSHVIQNHVTYNRLSSCCCDSDAGSIWTQFFLHGYICGLVLPFCIFAPGISLNELS
jgi:hypothetical protein